MLRLILTFVAMVSCSSLLSPVFAGVPLSVAVKKGQVEVSITGRGSSSGDAINLYVQRRVPETLRIDIEPGTVFRSKSGRAQSMVFRSIRFEKVAGGWTKANEIVLHNDKRRMFVLEAYCRDMTKPTPRETDQFAIEDANAKEAKILARGVEVRASNKVVQAAIWIDRDKASAKQLKRRFNVNDDEFQVATHLAAAAADVDVETSNGGTEVDVKLKELAAQLRAKMEARQAAAPMVRGDLARISRRDVQMSAGRKGGRVLAGLPLGHRVEVVRVAGDSVVATTEIDGRRRRGWLKLSDVRLTERAPASSNDGVLRDSALDFLNKLDVDVDVDAGGETGVNVQRSDAAASEQQSD